MEESEYKISLISIIFCVFQFADDVNSERISVRAEDNKLMLSIKNIALEDAADYTCAVSNDAGTTNKVTQVGIIRKQNLKSDFTYFFVQIHQPSVTTLDRISVLMMVILSPFTVMCLLFQVRNGIGTKTERRLRLTELLFKLTPRPLPLNSLWKILMAVITMECILAKLTMELANLRNRLKLLKLVSILT